MPPLVSIGIPFLNPGPFFKNSIRSVFAQTLQDWELILLNDGSTDGSLETAKSIRSDRVRLINDGRTSGLPNRLNQIAALAKGRYLARMDADDLMHPSRLEQQLAFLEKYPAAPIGSDAWIIDDEENIVGQSRPDNSRGFEPRISAILKWGGVIHPTLMAARDWFLRNPYDPGFARAEDRELFVRVIEESRVHVLDRNLFFYRHLKKINVQAYLQGYASERNVLRRYGRRLIGFLATSYLIDRSYIKSAILRVSFLLGWHNWVMKKKYSPISQAEREMAQRDIQIIHKTHVPGWED